MFEWCTNIYKEKEECSVCFEDRVLINYCSHHKFCKKCCNEWSKKCVGCPICRGKCVNKKFLVYDYDLKGLNEEELDLERLHIYFSFWHKKECVKQKHKFVISTEGHNILLYCKDCHIAELF